MFHLSSGIVLNWILQHVNLSSPVVIKTTNCFSNRSFLDVCQKCVSLSICLQEHQQCINYQWSLVLRSDSIKYIESVYCLLISFFFPHGQSLHRMSEWGKQWLISIQLTTVVFFILTLKICDLGGDFQGKRCDIFLSLICRSCKM